MKMVNEKNTKKFAAIIFVLILIVLAFLILKPILISIILGLMLAYIFYPVYVRINKIIKEKNISALIICIILLAIIFLALWYLVPILIKQTFEFYAYTQKVDLLSPFRKIFPTIFSTPEFSSQATISVNNSIAQLSKFILEGLINLVLSLPKLLLYILIIFFTLFFSLKEKENILKAIKGISPLTPSAESEFFRQSKDITNSIIYGHIVIGLIQGVLTGIGLFVFKIPNAALLTLLSIFLGILPMVGPSIVWIPASIYLLFIGRIGAGIGFLVYGLVILSWIDILLKPYIVSKRAKLHSFIALIGMIGGMFVFGVAGLLIGPLVLAYLIIIINFYKHKQFNKLFR